MNKEKKKVYFMLYSCFLFIFGESYILSVTSIAFWKVMVLFIIPMVVLQVAYYSHVNSLSEEGDKYE